MRKLKPPINIRNKNPKVCGNCKFMSYSLLVGAVCCLRDKEPFANTGDGFEWFRVCDRWVNGRELSK